MEISRAMMPKEVDLLVVGGGPGGYTAAGLAAAKGLKTALVEKEDLGGTCLNRGCVPTKTMLEHALQVAALRESPFMKGNVRVSLRRMLKKRQELIETSREGIGGVLAERGVRVLQGMARFTGPRILTIETPLGPETLKARNVIIATGAEEDFGPGLKPDGRHILNTDQALALTSLPRTVAVAGAGNRGVEFAQIFRALGAKVLLIEQQRRILPRAYWEISDRLKNSLMNRGIQVLTSTALCSAEITDEGLVSLILESRGRKKKEQVQRVILTGHRRPQFTELDPAAGRFGIEEGENDSGEVFKEPAHNVFVVGDAAGWPYSAHKAISQGAAAVQKILGEDPPPSGPIPHCIYGSPEVAYVGLTEGQALETGRSVKVGEFPFRANGRAGSMGKTEGTVLMVTDARTEEVLGVHMIGPGVTELVAAATLAIQNGIDLQGIRRTVFPHPTLSETFFEAALSIRGEAIHSATEAETLTP